MIVGVTAGGGRDIAHMGNTAPRDLFSADLQRLDGAVNRLVGQLVAPPEAFAEPDDTRKRIDDAKTAPGGLGNKEPAIIGA